jgi:predicted GTPase
MGTYRQFQEALETQLVRLTQFPELKGSNIAQLIDKLRQNRFNLVILGAFKRGKSTLINALLGEPILPTAIVPLTSVVTVLGYGEHLNIEVLFQNGERKTISQQELVDYITEKGNPRNRKGCEGGRSHERVREDYQREGVTQCRADGAQ